VNPSKSEHRWTLEYDSDVTSYFYLLRELGTGLRAAVKSLASSFPADAHKIQEDPETWEWLEARHWITFVVDRDKHWIYVTNIESATVE
jgi:hypothetical protein